MNIEDRKKVFDEFVKEPYRSMPAVWHVWKFMIWPNFFELYKRAIACIGEDRKDKGWISVKERLPDPYEDILIYCQKKGNCDTPFAIASGYRHIGHCFIVDNSSVNVTHWMPLPPPPEKENENRNS